MSNVAKTTIAIYDETHEKLLEIAKLLGNSRQSRSMAEAVNHVVEYYILVAKPPKLHKQRLMERR
jgi:hypothetical protein